MSEEKSMTPEITFESLEGFEPLVVCKGASGCGSVVLGDSEYEHLQWHARKGDPVSLAHLGGANDPGPMPPRS